MAKSAPPGSAHYPGGVTPRRTGGTARAVGSPPGSRPSHRKACTANDTKRPIRTAGPTARTAILRTSPQTSHDPFKRPWKTPPHMVGYPPSCPPTHGQGVRPAHASCNRSIVSTDAWAGSLALAGPPGQERAASVRVGLDTDRAHRTILECGESREGRYENPGHLTIPGVVHLKDGGPSGIRTLDLGIKSPLLWPAELTAHRLHGVGKGARTLDLRSHSPSLCQLSYSHQEVQLGNNACL